MRPKFGNDITNHPDSTDSREDDDDDGTNGIPPHIARIGGTITLPKVAGRGVIKVVGRCEDAKENNMLGKLH